MNLVTSISGCVLSYISRVDKHLKVHGKAYAIGVAMLAASVLAAYLIHSNLREEVHRTGGGRNLNAVEIPRDNFKIIDLTPGLRKLAAMIKGGQNDESPLF